MAENKAWMAALGTREAPVKTTDDLLSLKVKEKQRKEIDHQEELDELEHKAKKAELEKKVKESEVKTESAGGGFQVKGSVNIGDFDIMAERRKSEEMVGAALAKSDEEKKRLEERVIGAEKAVTELKYESVVKQMENMNKELMEKLSRYAEGANNKDDITSLFSKIETLEPILTKLGYAKASSTAGSGSADLQLQIALKKMEIDNDRAEREFKWKLLESEREYKRQERRDERELNIKAQELDDKRSVATANRNMLSEGIETLGRAIGAGMRDASAGGEEPIQQRPADQNQPRPQGQQPPPKKYHAEANLGDSGEIDCPWCQQPVTIGADTDTAICASCGGEIPIQRSPNEGGTAQ